MTRSQVALVWAGSLVVTLGCASRPVVPASSTATDRCDRVVHLPSMGTVFEIQYVDRCDGAEARQTELAREAQSMLDAMEAEMSLYQPGSPINRLNREGALEKPPRHLLAVTRASREHSERTRGAFDATVWPVLDAIKKSFRERKSAPPKADLDRLRGLVDFRAVKADIQAIRFARKGMMITLDGIAKGYAVDEVASLLERRGYGDHLVNFSGNMRIAGIHADGSPWRVATHDPVNDRALPVRMSSGSIASSGTASESYSKNKKWHHLIDPRTLRPANALTGTTVAGPSALVCDVLSTAIFVLGPELGPKVLRESYPEYRYRLILPDGRVISTLE